MEDMQKGGGGGVKGAGMGGGVRAINVVIWTEPSAVEVWRGRRGSVRVNEMHADAEQFACVIDDGAAKWSGGCPCAITHRGHSAPELDVTRHPRQCPVGCEREIKELSK